MKVAFYTYPEWAFGAIHEALCREFYKLGVLAYIIDWNRQFSPLEINSISNQFDVFVTVPGNSVTSLVNNFHVPYEKIVAIAHGKYDIEFGLSQGNDFSRFRNYAVVGRSIKDFSREIGVTREPRVLKNGVHFDLFYREVLPFLSNLGYAGTFTHHSFDKKTEIKRGYLAQEVANRVGMAFQPVTPRHYLTMPSYYESVSCVLMTSCEESFGLPMIEAAASGRLPIGTKVGVMKEYPEVGVVLPIEPQQFADGATQAILDRLVHPELYRSDCLKFQEYVRYNFDWSVVSPEWVNTICT